MIDLAIVAGLIIAALLFLVGVCIAALGARMWADAAAAVHRARAHGAQAEAQSYIDEQAVAAAEQSKQRTAPSWPKPTDEELLAAVLAGRQSTNGHVEPEIPTTLGDFEEETNPFDGGAYKNP